MDLTLAPTLITRYWPRLDRRARDLVLVVVGTLLVAAMAQVKIPLPFSPVPITGQTFAVLLVGASLGTRKGVASLSLYVILGVLGLPVYAGGAGGYLAFLGPTGGYLFGFVFAAYFVGWLAETGRDRRFRSALLVFLVGEVIIYMFGLPWLSLFVGVQKVLVTGLFPFLPGDLLKLAAAALALPAAWKLVQ
ncbi:MAG: biotin transporter BioY [Anaerolineales bacterium]|jgi:biotin transport system substrate-specific component